MTEEKHTASAPAGDGVEAWHPIEALTDERRYGGPLNLYDPAYDKSADNFGASWDGYWNDGDGSDDPDTGGQWVAAVWCNDHDEWHPTRINPTHYREPPSPPGAAALARPRAAVDNETALKYVAETLADYRAYLDGMTPLQHAEVAWEAGHKWPDEDDFDYASRVLQVLDALPDLTRPRAAVGERADDEALDPHLPDTVKSERRCGIQRSDWMTSWFVPWSPRNDNQNAEGPWSHWVALAHAIIAADEKAILALQSPPAKVEPCTCERARARGVEMTCFSCDKSAPPAKVEGEA